MSLSIKKHQQRIFWVAAGIVILVILLLALWGNKKDVTKAPDKASFKKLTLASPLSPASNEAHWIEKTQNAWRLEQDKTNLLDQNLKGLTADKEKQNIALSAQDKELNSLKSMVTELRQQMSQLQVDKNSPSDETLKKFQQQGRVLPHADESEGFMNEMDRGFIQYQAKLSKVSKPRIKTPENYVFSNTFAKAVVLQGADLSAGVLSQNNPDVMIFQILEDGVMPNGRRAKLKGCFFSASGVGDISSERGKFRTERLSCIHNNGTNLDIQVTGIVSDSKNGIRGRAVWRDGPMAKKAFWGSFWESMGHVGQQYSTDYSTSPLGSVATLQPAKIPLAAVSSGGAGAAKMYAQYTIKRAEMYHPIIQLPPATIVDVTFLKGFWLDGGNDSKEPDVRNLPKKVFNEQESDTPEEKDAQQFFYKNHSF